MSNYFELIFGGAIAMGSTGVVAGLAAYPLLKYSFKGREPGEHETDEKKGSLAWRVVCGIVGTLDLAAVLGVDYLTLNKYFWF